MSIEESAADGPRGVDRRTVLKGTAAAAGATAVIGATSGGAAEAATRYFRHGVASGDPRPHAVVLWTRVTPTAAATPGSGKGPRVTRRAGRSPPTGGSATSSARARVRHRPGPRPHRQARRHRAGTRRAGTTTGSATTASPPPSAAPAPRPPATPSPSGCASAWSAAPTSRPAGSAPTATSPTATTSTRCCTSATTSTSTAPASTATASPTLTSAATTRPTRWSGSRTTASRHAQYKTDPDLQRLHAKYPFVITWDDHEVANDQWKAGAENHDAERGRLPGQACPRAPGVRRVDAGADERHRRPPRRHPAVPPLPVRQPGRAEHARPAHLPRPAGRRPAPVPSAGRRDQRPGPHHRRPRAARLAQGRPAHRRSAVEAGRQPGDDRAGHVRASCPTDVLDPINDVTGLLPRTASPTTPTSGTATPTTAARCSPTSGTGRPRHRLPHRRHPLGLGLRAAVRRVHLPAVGDTPASSWCARSVTSNNLKDITGTPARTSSIAVETTIKANNRHVKYLNFDDHGFSVLDITPARVQMDWFVIGDRADRRTGRRLDRVLRLRLRNPEAASRRQAGGCLMCGPDAVGATSRHRATYLPQGPRRRRRARSGSPRRWPRRRWPRPASAATCWCSTAAGPTRSTAD